MENLELWFRDWAGNCFGNERTPAGRIFAGLATTLGNPKSMLFYMALLPNIMDAGNLSPLAVIPYYLAVIVVLTVVFSFYLLAAEKARRAMKSPCAMRIFNR